MFAKCRGFWKKKAHWKGTLKKMNGYGTANICILQLPFKRNIKLGDQYSGFWNQSTIATAEKRELIHKEHQNKKPLFNKSIPAMLNEKLKV